MKIIPINEINKEDIDSFDCGVEALNDFFRKYAIQNDRKNIGKTFVCSNEKEIVGFYTLSNAQIAFNDLSGSLAKGLPRYPIPCIRIARLAVDKKYQKEGCGSFLLRDALLRIVNLSFQTGIYFVIVDAKESSKKFYEHYGFIKLEGADLTYLLKVETIKRAL
jgi:GNAT superfamily N-acetyltransferase